MRSSDELHHHSDLLLYSHVGDAPEDIKILLFLQINRDKSLHHITRPDDSDTRVGHGREEEDCRGRGQRSHVTLVLGR